jgi:hypothetical protein
MTPASRALRLATLVLLATLTGCATTGTNGAREPAYRVVNGATYIPVPTAETEYSREAASLQLPARQAWPKHPFLASEAGTPEWYQIGYARQAADRFWFCSWASVAVHTADTAARQDAVNRLQEMKQLYYYTEALDGPSRPQLATELATAQRGDLAMLSNDLTLNC